MTLDARKFKSLLRSNNDSHFVLSRLPLETTDFIALKSPLKSTQLSVQNGSTASILLAETEVFGFVAKTRTMIGRSTASEMLYDAALV